MYALEPSLRPINLQMKYAPVKDEVLSAYRVLKDEHPVAYLKRHIKSLEIKKLHCDSEVAGSVGPSLVSKGRTSICQTPLQ